MERNPLFLGQCGRRLTLFSRKRGFAYGTKPSLKQKELAARLLTRTGFAGEFFLNVEAQRLSDSTE
jgi:hypothetical protein